MDENILDDSVLVSESGAVSSESVVSDSEHSENVVESDIDSSDSGSSDSSIESVEEDTNLTLDSLVNEETGGIPVYFVNSGEQESLIDEELGGVPVVITNDVSVLADYVGTGGSSYQLPTYYVDYFSGVLANMSDSDYVAFAYRDYTGSNSYVEHYLLVYDIVVDSDSAVSGSYPCIDICRYSGTSSYSVVNSTYALNTVPAFSYGSFGTLSDLRKGVSHNEMWAVLFAIGFAVVYSVCHDIFDYVMEHVYKRR